MLSSTQPLGETTKNNWNTEFYYEELPVYKSHDDVAILKDLCEEYNINYSNELYDLVRNYNGNSVLFRFLRTKEDIKNDYRAVLDLVKHVMVSQTGVGSLL